MNVKNTVLVGTLCSIASLSTFANATETATNSNGVVQTISQDYQDVKKSATTRAEDLKGDAKHAWQKAEQKTSAAGSSIRTDSGKADTTVKDKYTEAKDATKRTFEKSKHTVEKKAEQGKHYTSEKWDKTKNYTGEKWDKTKDYTKEKTAQAGQTVKKDAHAVAEKTGEVKKDIGTKVDHLKQAVIN
ncbi:hypothetical protein [Acinetobacter rathckeae]|uniref:hypothetical protein n=1 Tax=Acinetobacter rathckeae TaxID=2605272 RepID=UPI0018A2D606|nr:hypothetical protein [Acinetobacter rathckeae]MBF7687595.1 hypothetical protein [Acinetobacter rathckeae]